MAENYDFLRSFTFDGKETSHLFQIAKVNIPFLSKDNDFFTVGNTDGKHFRNTRLGEYTLSIDGFIITDNSGMTVSETKDELVKIINTDEPKQLILDLFPDRYFNAIYTGTEEYDATDPKYTPLTLTFDVPDSLAHAINPAGFTNVKSGNINLIYDSEFTKIDQYLKPWAKVLPETRLTSRVVGADFTTGLPFQYEQNSSQGQAWFQMNQYTRRMIPNLKVGDRVVAGIDFKGFIDDDEPEVAGAIIVEEWGDAPLRILKRHSVEIPKGTTEWTHFFLDINLESPDVKGINFAFGAYGDEFSVAWSRPYMYLNPEPTSITPPVKANSFTLGDGATVVDGNDGEVIFTLDGTKTLIKYDTRVKLPKATDGNTYTISADIKFHSDIVGDVRNLRLSYNYLPGGQPELQTTTPIQDTTKDKWLKIKGTNTVKYGDVQPTDWYLLFRDMTTANKISGTISLKNIKIVEDTLVYVPSEFQYNENIAIQNKGTYKSYPTYTFKMNSDNGFCGLVDGKGNVLQFGYPAEKDYIEKTRFETVKWWTFWGNDMPPEFKINQDFVSCYPNYGSDISKPNVFDGSLDMETDPDSVMPYFGTATDQYWHGPAITAPITAPVDNDRTHNFTANIRFTFNFDKAIQAMGRMEINLVDTEGKYVMGVVFRDSSTTNDNITMEMIYQGKVIDWYVLDKKKFATGWREINLERWSSSVRWRLCSIKTLDKNTDNVVIKDEYKYVHNVENRQNIMSFGTWFMRWRSNQHILMSLSDVKIRWRDTPYLQDVKNVFRNGDLVTIDTATRTLYINGTPNGTLNTLGNDWEKFVLPVGETTIKPVFSDFALTPEVSVSVNERYL